MDRLTQMEVFTAVVERGSFTAAAEHLGMAKSTVSRQVSELESRLGARLLYRTTRVIRPTEVGRAYVERCAGILSAIEEADTAVGEGGGAVRGVLRVASSPVFATMHLIEPVAGFCEKYPEVRVELRLDEGLINLVERGVDVALRITRLQDDSSLVARRLAWIRMRLWAAPSYLERKGEPATLGALLEHDCLTRDPPGKTWVINDPEGNEHRIDVTGPVSSNQGEALLEAIRLGLGIGLLPDFMTAELARRGEIVEVLRGHGAQGSGLYAMYPHRKLLSARTRAFVDHVAEAFKTPRW